MKRRRGSPDEDENETGRQMRVGEVDQNANAILVSPCNQQMVSTPKFAESFVHKAFEDGKRQIRLLRMLPSNNANPDYLQYSIGTYDFDRIEAFIAISYTWGDPVNERAILIDDKTCSVRQNCHYVLKHVYRHWELGKLPVDLLWIDSVCINQGDDEEKSLQVSFMGEIYAKATEVLACVGTHAEDSEFLVEKAWEVAEFRHDCSHNDSFMCQDCRLPWEEWVRSLGIETLTRLCMSCQTFGRRVYWTRIWIIQEVAKARSLRILCGTDILPWTAVRNLEDFLAMEMDEIESLSTTYDALPTCEANSMHDVFCAKKEPIQIDQIFSLFPESSCSEPRDRLYGLLGLVDWSNLLEPIVPDYKASIFDVAVRAAPYFSLAQIPEMLAAFQITSKDETVQRLIEQRRQVVDLSKRNTTVDAERYLKPLCNDPNKESITSMCAYIESDEDENMTATLRKMKETDYYIKYIPSDSTESGDISSAETSDAEESEQSANDMASLVSSTSLEMRPQPIVLGSEVAGYVCNKARKGDILVRVSNLNRCILVMRQNQGETFDIVGQGMLLEEYVFGCDQGVYDDSAEVALFNAKIELKISAEDLMLLFAMDIGGLSESYDLKDCWKQALTNVTSTWLRAARITEQTQMLAKDVVKTRDNSVPQRMKALINHSRMIRSSFPVQYNGWIEGFGDKAPEESRSSEKT